MSQSPGTIAVVDYGMGNLRSVWQALRQVADGREVCVTADPAVVAAAERVVFPGQGAMPDCMHELDARGLRQAVLDAARNKPFLGICIGLQMLLPYKALRVALALERGSSQALTTSFLDASLVDGGGLVSDLLA